MHPSSALDYLYQPRPLGLAKLLLTHGFCVKAVYLDSISPEEKADFFWLQEHAPELELIATIQVKMRVLPRGASGEVLAIGQKAAYFGRSRHFVNLVQGEGLYGFDGIPVSVSITRAIAGKSVPFINGIGEPASAINMGCSSRAAYSISSINFLSFPMIASISVSPEIKIRLS